MKQNQMLRSYRRWDSYLEGAVGMGFLLYLAFVFLMMTTSPTGR